MYLKKKIINLSTSYKSSLKISGNNSDRKFSKIFVINIFVSFLELLGIGLLIPIINFFIESEDSNISNFLTVNLGLSFNNIIFITALAFLIKNILIFFSNKYQVTVIYKLSQNISKKLYEKYINQDLNFYIKGDTSQALRNIFNECYSFSNGIILSFLKITSEIFLFLIFFIFLLFVNYKVTILITFFLSLIALIFFFSVQKKLRYFGDLRQFHESHRIKFIREGFESFSFLKIFDLSDFFLKKYHEHNKSSHNIFIKERVISFLPKLILETSLILLFCIIIFFLNLDDLNKNKIFLI